MNVEEARLAVHTAGDGCMVIWMQKKCLQIVNGRKYYRDRKRYEIRYTNTDKGLLNQFQGGLSKLFGVKPYRNRNSIRIRSKRTYDRIKILGGGGTYDWYIGKEILNSKNEIKRQWLKAFFDDEATIEKRYRRIRVKSMNLNGLKNVKKLLNDIKIKSSITGQNSDKSWYLTIRFAECIKFASKIGSDHSKKKLQLKDVFNKLVSRM